MSFWDWITGKQPEKTTPPHECVPSLRDTLDGIESETMIRLDLLRDRVRVVQERASGTYKLPQVARRGDR